MNRLDAYRAKRAAGRTPEPFTASSETGGRLFVVHLHDATRLHWDLRLEMGGALASWAVPKGPSPNPADKRMAVHVEDHPLPYGDFERSEEHTSELQSQSNLVCRLLLEKKKKN